MKSEEEWGREWKGARLVSSGKWVAGQHPVGQASCWCVVLTCAVSMAAEQV